VEVVILTLDFITCNVMYSSQYDNIRYIIILQAITVTLLVLHPCISCSVSI